MRTGIEYSKMKEIRRVNFKRPKIWSSTRMVVYEIEMVERFLENALHLDIPSTFLILAKRYLLTMFALKIILKYVQKLDVTCEYIEKVIVNEKGLEAMLISTKVAYDIFV